MNGQLRIDEMFAFIALDEDGTEGVVAFMGTPLVGADMERCDSYKPIAQAIATQAGVKVTLIKFSQRTEVEEINP